MPNRNFFIICSYGQSATRWLALALNLHEDIWCLHGIEKPPNSTLNNSMLCPIAIQNEMSKSNDKSFYGCIHRHNIESFLNYKDSPVLSNEVLNVIRHPITRFNSQYLAFSKMYQRGFDDNSQINPIDSVINDAKFYEKIQSWEKSFHLDLNDIDTRSYIACILSVFKLRDEIKFMESTYNRDVNRHVPMERMVSDREYFGWILSELTGGQLKAHKEYLDKVFSKTPIYTHNPELIDRSAGGVFSNYPEWKKSIMREVFAELSITKVFAPFDYDFSML